ncbi:UNVERIFIED_CONTAM: hypothetical protein GTU68_025672, partial [Idotea baltica]|nr:hypothetical protein [Idotea baltica]
MGFEDKYFKRILDVYKNKTNLSPIKSKFRNGKIPTFLLISRDGIKSKYWTEALKQIHAGECYFPCKFTDDTNQVNNTDAILLYLKHLKSKKFVQDLLPTRDPTQPWIMFSFEAPLLGSSIYNTKYTEFNHMFNRSMTFRKDSDIIFSHGFVVKKEDSVVLPESWRRTPRNAYTTEVLKHNNDTVITALISN